MTEGGISSWKKQEGDSFAPGDVLVEVVSSKSQSVTEWF
jgi:pyruvate dehydrogenase E2 component (dihydrolipoamide acetyltransferase)